MEDIQRESRVEPERSTIQNEIDAIETILGNSGEGGSSGQRGRGEKRKGSPEGGEDKGKSRRVAEEEYPWYEASQRYADEALSESMRRTRRIIEVTRADISAAIHSIRRSPGVPPNFPLSEWSNILNGRAVDLNAILGSLHLPQPVRETFGSVGGIPVRVPQVERSKSCKTSSDWGTAWRKTVQATTVAFPHRRDELDRYGQHIDTLFSSTTTATHSWIILYDEAVRAMVGGGESLSFDNHDSYQYLYGIFLLPGGIEANRGAPP